MPSPDDVAEFRILGPLEASKGGRAVEVGAGKQRALLAVLLLRAGEVVSADRLIDALWGEEPPPSALNSVHVYVSQLRKVLGDGLLETRGRGYVLAVEPEQLDLGRFERLLGEGRELLASGDAGRAAETLRAALALWRGPPLSDIESEPFAPGETARLEELHLAALEDRIEADLTLGRHSELVPELEGLVREHPLRERPRAQLMLALYRSGRQSEALETYQQARRMLQTELGLEPGRTLRELEAAILRHDAELDPPVRRRGPPPLATRKRRLLAVGAAVVVAAAAALAGIELAGGDAKPPKIVPNSLVRLDPKTLMPTQVVPVGPAPDLVVLAGGYAWVAHYILRDGAGGLRNAGDRRLTRVDLTTGEAEVVSGGVAPCGLAADPSGDVWVVNCFLSGSGPSANVVRIDAKSLQFKATWPVPAGDMFYRGLAYGDGSVWVSEASSAEALARRDRRPTLTRLDPQTGAQRKIGLVRWPSPLAWSERYGDLWISDFEEGSVSRLDAATSTTDTSDGVAIEPGHILVDGDSVWVADWGGPQVVRLRAVGATRPRSIPLPVTKQFDAGVWNVAAGAGEIWATTPREGALWRIDPRTNDVTRIAMPYYPTGVAADGDDVWVTVRRR